VRKKQEKGKEWGDYYEGSNILDKISVEVADFTLEDDLRQEILSGKRKRKLKNVTIKVDAFVKSRKMPFSVIPAKAGIQCLQALLDSGFRRSDEVWDFLRVHQG